eukprot:7377475-Prymnesium_polylepis.2
MLAWGMRCRQGHGARGGALAAAAAARWPLLLLLLLRRRRACCSGGGGGVRSRRARHRPTVRRRLGSRPCRRSSCPPAWRGNCRAARPRAPRRSSPSWRRSTPAV